MPRPSSQTSAATVLCAMELVEQELCSPQCLVARDDVWGICQCRCEGAYHGILADVQVEAKSAVKVREDGERSGCPDWCNRDGDGSTWVNHVANIAKLRMHDGTEVEVTASREQGRDDGSWEDPKIVIEAGELSGPHAPGIGLAFSFSVSEAWDLACLLTLAGSGGGWLTEALRRASGLFGPTHESGLDWFLWDQGMRPRPPEDDEELGEPAQRDAP